MRHIEYENTPSGLKKLSEDFLSYLDYFKTNPERPDNQLLELAKLTGYSFQQYKREDDVDPVQAQVNTMMALFKHPEISDIFMRKSAGENIENGELLKALLKYPETAEMLFKSMVKSGELTLTLPNRQQRKSMNKSRK